MRQFKNPANDYTEQVSASSALWAFLFGLLFFAAKGLWRHFVIDLLIVLFCLGAFGMPGVVVITIVRMVYSPFIPGVLAADYLRKGWQETTRREGYEQPD